MLHTGEGSINSIIQDINQFWNNVKLVFEQLYLILQLKTWKESTNVKSVRTKVHTSHMSSDTTSRCTKKSLTRWKGLGLWKMWNKIQIKVWIDRHVKTHEKNRHMRIKLKRGSQQLVLAFSWERKVWGCLTNICEMNALKHSILPSAWRGTWWADCTSKSPKRKRAEQLSCEEWGSFYQNQIASPELKTCLWAVS